VALGHELRRLATTARVLHVAAHPDDEDSALLATLARAHGARTVYLSLTRGEGGQNSIGGELGDGLGVLRAAELLAARRWDGAEQTFGACRDFGFSKSAAETLALWGEREALGDIVLAIRRYRPQIVIQRFAGEPRDGHGHHQASGLLCRRAFRAAADPAQFPEQVAAGWLPWQAARLYLDWSSDPEARCRVAVGDWLPLYGRSPTEIAYLGRSQHRSQDMGHIETRGEADVRLKLLDSVGPAVDPAGALFAGLDLTPASLLPDPGPTGPEWHHVARRTLAEAAEATAIATGMVRSTTYPLTALDQLATAVRLFRRAAERLDEAPLAVTTATWRLAAHQKLAEAQRALVLACGVQLDALATRPFLVPGQPETITARAWWPVAALPGAPRLRLDAPTGWRVSALDEPPASAGDHPPDLAQAWRVEPPADAEPSQPYWLRQPRRGERYAVADLALAGRPFDPPVLTVALRLTVTETPCEVRVPVQYRWTDPRRGERRRELQVVPAVTGELSPELVLAGRAVRLGLRLVNHGDEPQRGLLPGLGETELPPGATTVHLASDACPDALTWQARPLSAVHDVAYEHIAPRLWRQPVTLRRVTADVRLSPPGLKVGVVPGPEDDCVAALRLLGASVRVLDEGALEELDLAGLHTIVVGSRAYETNAALRRANLRLLAWARGGGRLVVLYQKYPYAQPGLAPYKLTYAQPHDRVTDETAPVRFLVPDHPLLTTPNRLGPADFAGWVQERGLYFARSWDPACTPLLSCADPGEPPRDGGLLVAPLGQGQWVYCAYSLFRQWPAGVPGAYRILANLVSR